MTSRTRVIVVDAKIDSKDVTLGLIADCVNEVTDLGARPLDPPPEIGARWQADFIVGVGRQDASFVLVLDLDRLLNQDGLLSPSLKVA
jgi:purine-binding chemotaxis protein CheW